MLNRSGNNSVLSVSLCRSCCKHGEPQVPQGPKPKPGTLLGQGRTHCCGGLENREIIATATALVLQNASVFSLHRSTKIPLKMELLLLWWPRTDVTHIQRLNLKYNQFCTRMSSKIRASGQLFPCFSAAWPCREHLCQVMSCRFSGPSPARLSFPTQARCDRVTITWLSTALEPKFRGGHKSPRRCSTDGQHHHGPS